MLDPQTLAQVVAAGNPASNSVSTDLSDDDAWNQYKASLQPKPAASGNLLKDMVSAPATILARPVQAAEDLGDYLGTKIEADRANTTAEKSAILQQDQQREQQKQTQASGPGGIVAPTPANGADLEKDVGRGIQTVAYGLSPAAGGAAFGAGSSLEQGNDLLSPETAVNTVLGLVGGKALELAGKPIINTAGKAIGAITPDLLKDIAARGSQAITDFAAQHEILPQAVSRAINTAADTVNSAAEKPFDVAGDAASALLDKIPHPSTTAPATLMNKVARINPTDVNSFKAMSGGITPGEFLDQRGMYGGIDDVSSALFGRFNQSREAVDTALAQLPGQYENKAVNSALKEVISHGETTSAEGAQSPYLSEAQTLLAKSQKNGLTMSEINQAKRLYERTVKLNYIKDGVSAGVERANNIDSAIRTWQQETADKLGFSNIRQLNKETQLSKMLLDAIGKKNNAQIGNNLVGLTDWLVASDIPRDPAALALLLGKKVFTSSKAQGLMAKALSSGEKLGSPAADIGPMNTGNALRLPGAGETSPASDLPPVMHMPNTALLPEDKTGINTKPLQQP